MVITSLEREEEILVYLCSVAERIIFKKELQEVNGTDCVPQSKDIELQRLKMVSSYI